MSTAMNVNTFRPGSFKEHGGRQRSWRAPALPDGDPVPAVTSLSASHRVILRTLLAILAWGTSLPTLQAQRPEIMTGVGGWTNSCDFCLASQGISPVEVGSSGARIDVRYLRLGTPYLEGKKVENAEREIETHFTQQYSLFYALSHRWSVSVIVPVASRHSETTGESGNPVTGNQFGFGDAILLVRYRAYDDTESETMKILSIGAGAKFPTGRTDGRDSQGNLLDAHIQLGTGSTDIISGASGFLSRDRTTLILNLLGGFTARGAHGHQFGNMLNYDLTVRYRVDPSDYAETRFFASLGLSGELRGMERQDGADDENSGGNVLYLTPGFQVQFSSIMSLEATYQYPIVHALHGRQLGEDYRIATAFQILFQ